MFPSLLCSKLCNDFCLPQRKSHILVRAHKNLYGLLAPSLSCWPCLSPPPPTFAPSAPATMHFFYPAILAPIDLCHWYSLCFPNTWSFTFYHWSLPDYITENFPPQPRIPPLPFLAFICSMALWVSTYFYMLLVSLSICNHYNVSHTPRPTPLQIIWTDNKTKTSAGNWNKYVYVHVAWRKGAVWEIYIWSWVSFRFAIMRLWLRFRLELDDT